MLMQLTFYINSVYAGNTMEVSMLNGLGLGIALLQSLALFIVIGTNGAIETLVS